MADDYKELGAKIDANKNGVVDVKEVRNFVDGVVYLTQKKQMTADFSAGGDARGLVLDAGIEGIMKAAKEAGLKITPDVAQEGLNSLPPSLSTRAKGR